MREIEIWVQIQCMEGDKILIFNHKLNAVKWQLWWRMHWVQIIICPWVMCWDQIFAYFGGQTVSKGHESSKGPCRGLSSITPMNEAIDGNGALLLTVKPPLDKSPYIIYYTIIPISERRAKSAHRKLVTVILHFFMLWN